MNKITPFVSKYVSIDFSCCVMSLIIYSMQVISTNKILFFGLIFSVYLFKSSDLRDGKERKCCKTNQFICL